MLDQSVITVIGTLGGVLVTATAGLLTALIAARNQRHHAAAESLAALQQKLREERRAAFLAYLQTYRALYAQALAIARDPVRKHVESASSNRAGLFEQEAPEQVLAFSDAHYELSIIAGRRVRNAARVCTAGIWKLATRCISGNPEEVREAESETRQPLRDLREAMRLELGVDD